MRKEIRIRAEKINKKKSQIAETKIHISRNNCTLRRHRKDLKKLGSKPVKTNTISELHQHNADMKDYERIKEYIRKNESDNHLQKLFLKNENRDLKELLKNKE